MVALRRLKAVKMRQSEDEEASMGEGSAADPCLALLLLTQGFIHDLPVSSAQDASGARTYREALKILADEPADALLKSGLDRQEGIEDIYSAIAVSLYRISRDRISNSEENWATAQALLRNILQPLDSFSSVVESPSHKMIIASLIFAAYQYGVIHDDELVWDLVSNILSGVVYGATLDMIDELCVKAKGWATPYASLRWARLRYALLTIRGNIGPGYEELLDNRLMVIADIATDACIYKARLPADISWISEVTKDILREIASFAASGADVPDTWLGACMLICDALLAVNAISSVRQILQQAVEAVSLCREGGPSALDPDAASPFREEAEYLIRLIGSRTQGNHA
jgi:hypothetical protein